MPKVYIPNKSHLDFTNAERFGTLVYITEGRLRNSLDVKTFSLACEVAMADARREDYLLITSLHTICSIAAAHLAVKFGCVNLLIFHRGHYVAKTVEILNDNTESHASRPS